MISKFKILVLFLAFGAFAAPETIQSSSAAFSFVPAGVLQSYHSYSDGSTFSCQRLPSGKQGMVFAWSISGNSTRTGNLSLYSISGRLIKSFDLNSRQESVTWTMPQAKLASGVYFAVLKFGTTVRNAKIMY